MTADCAAFLAIVRALHKIDRNSLPELLTVQWQHFRDDPVRYLLYCNDAHQAAIWREVEKRQAKAVSAPIWIVTELSYDKITAQRAEPSQEAADTLADKWRSQSAGKVEVRQVEVPS